MNRIKIQLMLVMMLLSFTVTAQKTIKLKTTADSLYYKENYTQAMTIYKLLIKAEPDSMDYYQKLSFCFIADNKLDSAYNIVQRALAIDNNNSMNYISLTQVYYYKQQFDSALTSIDKAITLSPDSSSYYVKKAAIFLAVNKSHLAMNALKDAIRINKSDISAYDAIIELFNANNLYDSALVYSRIANSINPTPKYVVDEAILLYKKARYTDATLLLNENLTKYPGNIDLIKNLANIYIQIGQFNDAINTLTPFMSHYDKDIFYYYILAHYYQDQFDSAQIYISIAHKNDPNADIFYFLEGYINNKNMDYHNAFLNFSAAQQLNPSYIDYYSYLCTAKNMMNSDKSKIDSNLRLIGISSQNILKTAKQYQSKKNKYISDRINSKFKIDETSLSIDEYFTLYLNTAMEKDYSGYQSIDKRVSDAFDQKDYKYAVELSKIYINEHPTSLYAYFIIANSYYYLENYQQAIYYLTIYYGFLNGILGSGDGNTMESAYVVNSVIDEYLVLRALNIQSAGQTFVSDKKHCYDVLYYYDNDEKVKVFFNIDLFYKK